MCSAAHTANPHSMHVTNVSAGGPPRGGSQLGSTWHTATHRVEHPQLAVASRTRYAMAIVVKQHAIVLLGDTQVITRAAVTRTAGARHPPSPYGAGTSTSRARGLQLGPSKSCSGPAWETIVRCRCGDRAKRVWTYPRLPLGVLILQRHSNLLQGLLRRQSERVWAAAGATNRRWASHAKLARNTATVSLVQLSNRAHGDAFMTSGGSKPIFKHITSPTAAVLICRSNGSQVSTSKSHVHHTDAGSPSRGFANESQQVPSGHWGSRVHAAELLETSVGVRWHSSCPAASATHSRA